MSPRCHDTCFGVASGHVNTEAAIRTVELFISLNRVDRAPTRHWWQPIVLSMDAASSDIFHLILTLKGLYATLLIGTVSPAMSFRHAPQQVEEY